MKPKPKPLAATLSEPKPEERDSGEPRGELAAAHVRQKWPNWIPVTERLPIGEEVLYWDGERVSTFFPATGDAPENQAKARCAAFGITHWMPFPDAPSIAPSNAVLPPPVSESPVGSTATGVSDEEIAAQFANSIMRLTSPASSIALTEHSVKHKVLTAIRKSKSLSEPKESEEEKQGLGEPGAI